MPALQKAPAGGSAVDIYAAAVQNVLCEGNMAAASDTLLRHREPCCHQPSGKHLSPSLAPRVSSCVLCRSAWKQYIERYYLRQRAGSTTPNPGSWLSSTCI